MDVKDKSAFLEDLRLATYGSCLAAYIQGINCIDHANRERHWNINFHEILQSWRAGCIIQEDYLSDLLEPIFKDYKSKKTVNLLFEPAIMADMKKTKPALQRIVAQAVQYDHVVPAISASLEYFKYQTGTSTIIHRFDRGSPANDCIDLPTSYYEAQLDFFGNHMYDRKDDDSEDRPTEGKYSFEWKAA